MRPGPMHNRNVLLSLRRILLHILPAATLWVAAATHEVLRIARPGRKAA